VVGGEEEEAAAVSESTWILIELIDEEATSDGSSSFLENVFGTKVSGDIKIVTRKGVFGKGDLLSFPQLQEPKGCGGSHGQEEIHSS
jgi:hypothetical protein